MSKTLLNGDVISLRCITVEEGNNIDYYLLCKDKGIYVVDKDTIVKINNMGYDIENFRTIIGLKNIKNFKRYNFSDKETIALKKQALYTKMYSNDSTLKFVAEQKSR